MLIADRLYLLMKYFEQYFSAPELYENIQTMHGKVHLKFIFGQILSPILISKYQFCFGFSHNMFGFRILRMYSKVRIERQRWSKSGLTSKVAWFSDWSVCEYCIVQMYKMSTYINLVLCAVSTGLHFAWTSRPSGSLHKSVGILQNISIAVALL